MILFCTVFDTNCNYLIRRWHNNSMLFYLYLQATSVMRNYSRFTTSIHGLIYDGVSIIIQTVSYTNKQDRDGTVQMVNLFQYSSVPQLSCLLVLWDMHYTSPHFPDYLPGISTKLFKIHGYKPDNLFQ